ncbi:MAG: hypothetical protein VX694_03400, partial [Planctomycetota bacterium]|nr:hypothetical protein [Planctomycetota bacterium]
MDSDSLHDDGAAAKLRVSGAKLSTVDLSVVVPLYNESESVPELLRRLDETLGPLHEQAMQGLDNAHEGVTDRKVRERGMRCE